MWSELEDIRSEVLALGVVVVGDSRAALQAQALPEGHQHSGHLNSYLDIRVDPESYRRVEEIVAEKTASECPCWLNFDPSLVSSRMCCLHQVLAEWRLCSCA